jgi:hypothetical protein
MLIVLKRLFAGAPYLGCLSNAEIDDLVDHAH